MCQLLETVKVFRNVLHHINYHTDRVNRSRYLLFGKSDPWDLSTIIRIPDLNPDVVYRCRFLYGEEPGQTEFIPYVRREIRRLNLVDCGALDYSFKYADRSGIEKLRQKFPVSDDSDILMIKNGLITDTSIANVVFTDGNKWYTPSAPLLRGTKRQYYLDRGEIHSRNISVSDLEIYKNVRLINAMIDLEESDDIPVEHIL